MIKKHVLIFLLLPLISVAQDKFSRLNKNSMSTSILYDRAFKVVDLTKQPESINALYYLQAYSELEKSDYNSNFESVKTLQKIVKESFRENFIPIAILNTEFDILKRDSFENGLITIDSEGYFINTSSNDNSVFEHIERTFASPLKTSFKGLQATYKLLPELITNTSASTISLIEANFNDDLGFRQVIANQNISVSYHEAGLKQINFRITLNNNTVIEHTATITIKMSSQDYNAYRFGPGDESPITAINSTISYQGYDEASAFIGTGEYKIYYDNVDGVLDKPIIFIDGFDPGDSRDIPSMYQLLDFGNPISNLGDIVRDEGFDLIVLNFPTYVSTTDNTTIIDGGGDYVQRNAFILTELINTINSLKVGSEQNVVIGPSMGGLISRYALRYMEQNSMTHDTRLYLSFDSPHLGANVPIGLQYLFNYMLNGDPGVVGMEALVNGLLNSAAAKEMLVDHYTSHLQDGSLFLQDPNLTAPVGAQNFRTAFQTELDVMGFPQSTRNIAIVNGSGLSATTGTAGMDLLDHTFDTGVVNGLSTRAIMNVKFAPTASQTITVTDFVGQAFLFVWFDAFTYSATAESPAFTDGVDSAPGGQFDMAALDDGTDPLIAEFVANLNSQYFDFIPTLSGLSITDTNDWYAIPNTASSPFASTFIPDANEPHVTLTDANVAFALAEIRQEPLYVDTFIDNSTIKLEQNPITNSLTILSDTVLENSKITIVDITGKTVYNNTINLEARTSIALELASGLYILNIETNTNSSLKTKFLVK